MSPASYASLARRVQATRLWRALDRHPYVGVAAIASVVRIAFALASFFLNPTYLVPDETGYIGLAAAVASSGGADSWVPGYGEGLFSSTWVFSAPLSLLFRVLWPTRLLGQLLAAVFGVVASVLAVRLGREALPKHLAVAVGLLVALLPSQVLWSSVVLRESMVWSALLALALLVVGAARSDGRRLLLVACGVLLVLLALGHLRQQTAVVAAWAVAVSAWVMPSTSRPRVGAVLTVVAAVGPALAGMGIAGVGLVTSAAPTLAQTRTYMSIGASSGFTPTSVLPNDDVSTTTTIDDDHGGVRGAAGIAQRDVQYVVDENGEQHAVVVGADGAVYEYETGAGSSLRHLPSGVVATAVRPFPWEFATGALGFAAVEAIAWYLLYGLAIVGVVASLRRRPPALVFPVVLTGLVVGVGALTQGNLGTAFRHRAQMLWAIALLAAVGAEALRTRRARPVGVAVAVP